MVENLIRKFQEESFSCRNCGKSFTVFTSKTEYKTAMLDQCSGGCSIFEKIKCSNCNMRITVFWCTGHDH